MKTSLEILQAFGERVMGRLKCTTDGPEALELLLDARADPNQRDPEYQADPFYWCISNHMRSLKKMG